MRLRPPSSVGDLGNRTALVDEKLRVCAAAEHIRVTRACRNGAKSAWAIVLQTVVGVGSEKLLFFVFAGIPICGSPSFAFLESDSHHHGRKSFLLRQYCAQDCHSACNSLSKPILKTLQNSSQLLMISNTFSRYTILTGNQHLLTHW